MIPKKQMRLHSNSYHRSILTSCLLTTASKKNSFLSGNLFVRQQGHGLHPMYCNQSWFWRAHGAVRTKSALEFFNRWCFHRHRSCRNMQLLIHVIVMGSSFHFRYRCHSWFSFLLLAHSQSKYVGITEIGSQPTDYIKWGTLLAETAILERYCCGWTLRWKYRDVAGYYPKTLFGVWDYSFCGNGDAVVAVD